MGYKYSRFDVPYKREKCTLRVETEAGKRLTREMSGHVTLSAVRGKKKYVVLNLSNQILGKKIHCSPRDQSLSVKYLRNRESVLCFYRVIQTRVEVWENKKCCGNTNRRRVFPQLFRVLPNFHECLYNSIETRSTCFIFILENTATRKRKTTC